MKKTSMVLLVIAIVALVFGLVLNTGPYQLKHSAAAFYVILPVGSIFLGLFLTFRVFESEAEAYDRETRPAKVSRLKKR